jgi:DNA-directed RNA polymerase subunit E'/Rpb7
MDPLFERRELTKKVHIHSKYIQKNIQASLLAQLKTHYQGRCLAEGYIQPDSFTILKYSVGRANYLRGGVDYNVTFQADVSMPHPGQHFRGNVVLKSKIGLHVELSPLKVLIPRDLHLGNQLYEKTEPGQEVEFEIIGSQFKQGDEEIIVVAKLIGEAEEKKEGGMMIDVAPIPVKRESDGEMMQITVVPTSEEPKKRKLKRTEPVEVK